MISGGFSLLEPEVAGSLGARTVMDTAPHPPEVERLHYEMQGWLGEDLLESFPVYIVTRTMGDRLEAAELEGFTLREVEVTRSPLFEELYPGRELPPFWWLDVTGAGGETDLGVEPSARLVVSDRALSVLRSGSIENCLVTPWSAD